MNAIFLLIFIIAVISVFPVLFKGAIYLPTRRKTVAKMIEFADIKPGDIAVDLGSGDGRLVIALAKAGAEAHGYEINPLLVLISRYKISKAGLKNKAFVHLKNFWKEDLSQFNVVMIFGINFAMNPLKEKLEKELKSGARIISNSFSFPGWEPIKEEDTALFYKKL